MSLRKMPTIGALLLVATLLLVSGVWLMTVTSAQGESLVMQPQSLVNAPPSKVTQAALDYTYKHLHVLTGKPEAILTRSVTVAELPQLGLASIATTNPEPPLALVVLKGDFDITNAWPGSSLSNMRVTYVAYVFDLQSGTPTLTTTSLHGGAFRKLLNNPNLPEDKSEQQKGDASSGTSPANAMPPVPQVINVPNGVVAPGVTPEGK